MGKGHSTLLWTCARTRTRPDARQCTTFLRPDSTVRVCKSAPSRAQITPSPRLPTFPPHTRRRALPTSPSPAPTRRIFVACDAQRYRRDRSNEMKQTPAMRGGRALTECLGEPADGLCTLGTMRAMQSLRGPTPFLPSHHRVSWKRGGGQAHKSCGHARGSAGMGRKGGFTCSNSRARVIRQRESKFCTCPWPRPCQNVTAATSACQQGHTRFGVWQAAAVTAGQWDGQRCAARAGRAQLTEAGGSGVSSVRAASTALHRALHTLMCIFTVRGGGLSTLNL